jgi:hypothetical protein
MAAQSTSRPPLRCLGAHRRRTDRKGPVRLVRAVAPAHAGIGALAERLQAVAHDPDEVRRVGIDHATRLCRRLLDGGAPGLHFYTMNKAAATLEVCANLGWQTAARG